MPPRKKVVTNTTDQINAKLLDELHKRKEGKVRALDLRQQNLEAQRRNNYKMDYERLQGIASTRTITPGEAHKLKNRQTELRKLHKQSVNPKKHPIENKK